MKYILTNENDEIFNISETQGYQENGNYLMNEGIEGEVAIPQSLVKGIFEVEEIPKGVEVAKYCYTEEKGFYKNENYVEPYNEEKEIAELKEQITELQLVMVENDMEV